MMFGRNHYNEIRFSMKPQFMDRLVLEILFSRDWYVGDNANFDLGVTGFSAGIGVDKNIDKIEISMLIHYLTQSHIDFIRNTVFLSSNLRINITHKNFMVISWNYYFGEIRFSNKFQRSLINFGIGINFY